MPARPNLGLALVALLALLAGACLDTGAPLGPETEEGTGPRVAYDPLERPIPNVPFPWDALLTPTDDTFRGRRWNISEEAPTGGERRIRRLLNTLDGFGPWAPIFIPFEEPIDLSTVSDASVLVLNIEPGHPREGELVSLDLGRGFFPWQMEPYGYWAFDEHKDLETLVFPGDNLADVDGDGALEFTALWEVATNTLILRPILPLAQGATHAVLILDDVRGPSTAKGPGPPVRSPFPTKAHPAETERIDHALELAGLDAARLAFGWTYTTSDVATPILTWREGVWGEGPLGWIGEAFPPGFHAIDDLTVTVDGDTDGDDIPDDPTDHRYILQPELLAGIFELVGPAVGDQYTRSVSFDHVDYFAFGMLRSPDLRTGESVTIGVDAFTGEGEVVEGLVPFFASIPKTVPGVHEPPFDSVVYFHGTGTSRMELLAVANILGRFGLAGVAIDEVGHGPIIPDVALALEQADLSADMVELLAPVIAAELVPEDAAEFEDIKWYEALEKMNEIGFWKELAVHGRTTDENGNGALESSESFFFADPFKQCASLHQDIVDGFFLVRTLRSLDPDAVPPGIEVPADATAEALEPHLLAGDFNADGVLDLGGPDTQIGTAGTSLGGFHAALLAALDKEVTVATPNVGGAGFMDIMTRSDLHFVTERIFLETFGPRVIGCPDGEGGIWLSFNLDTEKCKGGLLEAKSFAHLPAVAPGDGVVVDNLANGERTEGVVGDAGGFALPIPSDRWDPIRIEVIRAAGETSVVPVQSPYHGTGFERNSPRFRRFLGISQHVLDRCDPVIFARHLFIDPLPGHPPTNILFEQALGDRAVPIASGVMLGVASGALGIEGETWRPVVETFIEEGLMLGSPYDPDDILGDNPPQWPVLGLRPPVETGAGVAAMRFADVDGYHEWLVDIDPDKDFDRATYNQNQLALFHRAAGQAVVDDLCIEDATDVCLEDPEALFE